MNHISKPIKTSVAVFLLNPDDSSKFLIVKRPNDDDSLPNVYGLPAGSIKEGELPEQVVKRIGIEKLNTEIEATKFIGSKYIDRGAYVLILMDIDAKLIGKEPDVLSAVTVVVAVAAVVEAGRVQGEAHVSASRVRAGRRVRPAARGRWRPTRRNPTRRLQMSAAHRHASRPAGWCDGHRR